MGNNKHDQAEKTHIGMRLSWLGGERAFSAHHVNRVL